MGYLSLTSGCALVLTYSIASFLASFSCCTAPRHVLTVLATHVKLVVSFRVIGLVAEVIGAI